jgi:hypothetical protein
VVGRKRDPGHGQVSGPPGTGLLSLGNLKKITNEQKNSKQNKTNHIKRQQIRMLFFLPSENDNHKRVGPVCRRSGNVNGGVVHFVVAERGAKGGIRLDSD